MGRRLTGATLVGAACLAASIWPSSSLALDPHVFETVSSGVVLVKATGCPGAGASLGSGFFVGTKVVMTARHVVNDCRTVRVLIEGGRWISVAHRTHWRDGKAQLDVATLTLMRPVVDVWVFSLRSSQVPLQAKIAALGHPLGEAISETSGRMLARSHDHLILRVLSGQGYSGGPIVDKDGRVVGLINEGLFGRDPGVLTGAYVGDNIIAYDFSSHWGRWRRTLCKGYRNGGVADCGGNARSTPPPVRRTPPPPPRPPAPPKPIPWVPPPGFTLWTGAGDYTRGTVAYEYEASCTPASAYAVCWGVKVVSSTGCRDGLFVKTAAYDDTRAVVDDGIDEIPFAAAGQIVFAQGDTFAETAATYGVTSIDCYDF